MSEKSHHNPHNEVFEPTSLEDLERGSDALERMLRDARNEDATVGVAPDVTHDDTAPQESNEDSSEKQLSLEERKALDPAAPVVDRAKYLRQAFFRQQYEQNWELAKGNKDEKKAVARAAADNAIADMSVVDGYRELIGLRDTLRDEKRAVSKTEYKFVRYMNKEEDYLKASAGVRFNGKGGLFDAGYNKEPSVEAARARIESVKEKLQKEFEDAGSPDDRRAKHEADLAALEFYAGRVGQSEMYTNEDWHVGEFLETQARAKGKGKKSAERKQAESANKELDTRFDEVGKATRALTLLSKHDSRLAKTNIGKPETPKRDETLSYVAVLDEPLGSKKEVEKPEITQITAKKSLVEINEDGDGETDEDEPAEPDKAETEPHSTADDDEEGGEDEEPVAPITPTPPAQPNPNHQIDPNQHIPDWLQTYMDQMNQILQDNASNRQQNQQLITQIDQNQQAILAMLNAQNNNNAQPAPTPAPAAANANPQPANANQVHPYHQLYMNAVNQGNPPAGAQQGGQQPPVQGGGGAGNPPAGGGANPNQNNGPTPEQLVTDELNSVREALAHEKSKTWRNSRLGRLAWRMAGGLFGANSRVGRSYRNLENLENRYAELNKELFDLTDGSNLAGLTPEQIAMKQGKYIFGEQEKLREATRELMTENRRMRKFGNWFLKHKKWVIGGSVVLMPFTGGMSLAAGMGALAGFKSDQKFAGMRDTITKMNANEVKHAIMDSNGDFGAGMKLSMDRFDEDVSWENFKRSGAIALGITALTATGLAQAYVAAQIKSASFEGITPWLKAHTMQQLPYGPDMSRW